MNTEEPLNFDERGNVFEHPPVAPKSNAWRALSKLEKLDILACLVRDGKNDATIHDQQITRYFNMGLVELVRLIRP